MEKNRILLVALFIIGIISVTSPNFFRFGNPPPTTGETAAQQAMPRSLSYSELINSAHEGKIKSVILDGRAARGTLDKGEPFTTTLPNDARVSEELTKSGVDVRVVQPAEPSFWRTLMISWGPMLIFVGIWIYIMKKANGGKGGAFSFGKSRARLHVGKGKRAVTFKDVAGIDEAKVDLMEIVDFLKAPAKFERLGARIPKGVLLVGPPGTGKTLIARAVAGEANVPFFTISGSDFVEMFVGVGASRVRDMFEQGKKNAPCIIFIDEIDAMGRHRGAGHGGGNDEREQTLNQMLVEMDGFADNEGVILIAATNRPDVLDPALLRPGRFDRQIVVSNADIAGREAILAVHIRKITYGADVDIRTIARGTPGFSGAELENLCNEAALMAARGNARAVRMIDFERAKDKILMGDERRTLMMSEKEKLLTAYHEAGHALCALLEPASDPIHKATIIPRGRALGLVMRLPESDRVSLTLEKIMADLCVGMGGRVAEQIIFGEQQVTTGASSDIKMVTSLARSMVKEWGFSDKLGTVAYGEQQQEVFLGQSMGNGSGMSPVTARIVEEEIKEIIDRATVEARTKITENMDGLHAIARGLLERETLNGAEIKMLYDGFKLPDIPPLDIETEHTATAKPILDPGGALPALASRQAD